MRCNNTKQNNLLYIKKKNLRLVKIKSRASHDDPATIQRGFNKVVPAVQSTQNTRGLYCVVLGSISICAKNNLWKVLWFRLILRESITRSHHGEETYLRINDWNLFGYAWKNFQKSVIVPTCSKVRCGMTSARHTYNVSLSGLRNLPKMYVLCRSARE